MLGVSFGKPETADVDEKDWWTARAVRSRMLEHGVWAICDCDDTIRMYPALNIRESVLREGLEHGGSPTQKPLNGLRPSGHGAPDAADFSNAVSKSPSQCVWRGVSPALTCQCESPELLLNERLDLSVANGPTDAPFHAYPVVKEVVQFSQRQRRGLADTCLWAVLEIGPTPGVLLGVALGLGHDHWGRWVRQRLRRHTA